MSGRGQTATEKVLGFNPVTDIRIFGSNNPLINSNADDILPFLNTALSQTMERKDLWLALKEVRISNAASRAPNSSGPFRFKIVEDGSTLKAIKLN